MIYCQWKDQDPLLPWDLRMILNWITQLWTEQGREPEIRFTSVCNMLGILKWMRDISSIKYSLVVEHEHQQHKFSWVYFFDYNITKFCELYSQYIVWVVKDVIHFPNQLWCNFVMHTIEKQHLLPCHKHLHQATLPSSIEMPPCEGVFHLLKYVPR